MDPERERRIDRYLTVAIVCAIVSVSSGIVTMLLYVLWQLGVLW